VGKAGPRWCRRNDRLLRRAFSVVGTIVLINESLDRFAEMVQAVRESLRADEQEQRERDDRQMQRRERTLKHSGDGTEPERETPCTVTPGPGADRRSNPKLDGAHPRTADPYSQDACPLRATQTSDLTACRTAAVPSAHQFGARCLVVINAWVLTIASVP
jgi:hypothetical protein